MRRREALACIGAIAVGATSCDERGATAEAVSAGSAKPALGPAAQARMVVVGGGLTETVFALGKGLEVVAVDSSSYFPPETGALPKVGYQRALSAEGVLAQSPTLVLHNDDAGPPAVLDQLRAAGVRMENVSCDDSVAGALDRIRRVGEIIGRPDEARRVIAKVEADVAAAKSRAASSGPKPRVLFLYARGRDTLQVAGRDTGAKTMIELAGGVNAVDGFEGFKELSAEAAIEAAPDVILVPSRGLASVGGNQAVFDLPGLGATPAAKEQRVVAMDDLLLLGFGPRVGEALLELATLLHPDR